MKTVTVITIGCFSLIAFFLSLNFFISELTNNMTVIKEEIIEYKYLGQSINNTTLIPTTVLMPISDKSNNKNILLINEINVHVLWFDKNGKEVLTGEESEDYTKIVRLYKYTYNYKNSIFEKIFLKILKTNENGDIERIQVKKINS